MEKVTAIIVAGGKGTRMQSTIKKQYLKIQGQAILVHTVQAFQKHPHIHEIIIVTGAEDVAYVEEMMQASNCTKVTHVVSGGKERQDSVANGLEVVSAQTTYVMIHDGARPLITERVITRALEETYLEQATIVGVPVKDTIKVVTEEGFVSQTPERKFLWSVQTPQTFEKELIKKAYREAVKEGRLGTDDSTLVEAIGHKVKIVEGEYTNIKITTPEDLEIAEKLFQKKC